MVRASVYCEKRLRYFCNEQRCLVLDLLIETFVYLEGKHVLVQLEPGEAVCTVHSSKQSIWTMANAYIVLLKI